MPGHDYASYGIPFKNFCQIHMPDLMTESRIRSGVVYIQTACEVAKLLPAISSYNNIICYFQISLSDSIIHHLFRA